MIQDFLGGVHQTSEGVRQHLICQKIAIIQEIKKLDREGAHVPRTPPLNLPVVAPLDPLPFSWSVSLNNFCFQCQIVFIFLGHNQGRKTTRIRIFTWFLSCWSKTILCLNSKYKTKASFLIAKIPEKNNRSATSILFYEMLGFSE